MKTKFIWPVRVYYEDTDAEGVVYYANYLKFFERARTEWLRASGVDLTQLQRRDGVVFVVAEANVHYRSAARLNDTLDVSAGLDHLKGAQMTFVQRATIAGENKVACEATFRVACVDHGGFVPRRVPKWVQEKLWCVTS